MRLKYLFDLTTGIKSRDVRHHHIDQDKVWKCPAGFLKGIFEIQRSHRRVSFLFQGRHDHFPGQGIVIDHKNIFFHRMTPFR